MPRFRLHRAGCIEATGNTEDLGRLKEGIGKGHRAERIAETIIRSYEDEKFSAGILPSDLSDGLKGKEIFRLQPHNSLRKIFD